MRRLILVLLAVALLALAMPGYGGVMEERSIMGGVGMWEPDDPDERGMIIFGGFRFGVKENFAIEGVIGHWSADREEEGWELEVRTIPISFSGLFFFPLSEVTPIYGYGGGGLDYHMWKGEYKEDGRDPEEDDESSLGFHFRGGIEYEVSQQIRIGVDLKYFFGEADFEDSDLGAYDDYNGMCLSGSLRYVFGQ